MTTLTNAIVITPAVAAVTITEFHIVDVQENYGYGLSPGTPGLQGRGRQNSVEVTVAFPSILTTQRVIAWEGDAYLAVRGTWTDATLNDRVAAILQGVA